MNSEARKALVEAYMNRKRVMGAFAVECTASGVAWVGESVNLDTRKNAIWSALKLGAGRNPAMQTAWSTFGAEAFTFTVLETLKDEDTAFPDTKLKALKLIWIERLGAHAL